MRIHGRSPAEQIIGPTTEPGQPPPFLPTSSADEESVGPASQALALLEERGANGTEPSVTVCIPTRNRVGYLTEAISSVLQQSRPDWTILVGDNASTDATPALLAALSGPHLQVLRHDSLRPRVENYNELIRHVETPFVMVLADDDRLRPEFLAATLPLLEEDPDLAMAYTDRAEIDAAGNLLREPHPADYQIAVRLSGSDFIRRLLAQSGTDASPSASVMRTALLPRPVFRPEDGAADVSGTQLRLARRGSVAYYPATLAERREHADRETAAEVKKARRESTRLALVEDRHALRLRFLAEIGGSEREAAAYSRITRLWYRKRLLAYMMQVAGSGSTGVKERGRLLRGAARRDPGMVVDTALWGWAARSFGRRVLAGTSRS
jgi:glycosyltransferase involved in cell wall biosynthesis